MKSLSEIKKQSLSDVLAGIKDASNQVSRDAGMRLSRTAAEYGLNTRDYLNLAIEFDAEPKTKELASKGLSGYEMAKVALNLPTRNDFANQITLAQASDTFAMYPGARNMFRYVVDDMLRWATRQDNVQKIDGMIAGSRTIQGVELVRKIIELNGADAAKSFNISELGEIPFRDVKTADTSVKFGKVGSGIRISYEFARNASLDVLTPFAARIAREKELMKIEMCTNIMIAGDGTSYHPAATVYKQVAYDSSMNDGKLHFDGLIKHIIAMNKLGVSIDTVAGNWDAYEQWIEMFKPTANVTTDAATRANNGTAPKFGQWNPFGAINFVLNQSVPAGKLLCFSRPDTIEELVQAGSQLSEEDRNILNQSILYTNTENVGYSLIFGDTRSIYDYASKS